MFLDVSNFRQKYAVKIFFRINSEIDIIWNFINIYNR